MRDQLKHYIDDLNHQLYHDRLTDLPNMRHFFSLAMETRNILLAEGKKPVMLYFDIIGLRHYNRQYGFEKGDQLIINFARILSQQFGDHRICRFNGDHFAAVTDEDHVQEDMKAIMGPERAVVVMNLSEEERSIDVSVEALGFKGPISLYDCFTHSEREDLACETSFSLTLAPHASAAFFAKGKRIEKSVYQAEESYMKMFSTIEGVASPSYLPSESADMGMYAAGLGSSEDNWLQWDNVFSCRGGEYIASIRYASKEKTAFTVSVNGEDITWFENLTTGDDSSAWDTVNFKVKLNKGLNTVRLLNATGFMPGIDCLTLRKAER